MRLDSRLALVGLAAALCGGPVAAQAPAGLSTGELARLCAAGTSTADMQGATAAAACRGFIIGAGQFHSEAVNVRAGRPPIFCLPETVPTLESVQGAFAAWVQANPEVTSEKAVVGMLRWAAATYPCPPQPAPAGRAGR
jgi:hypothetical protein